MDTTSLAILAMLVFMPPAFVVASNHADKQAANLHDASFDDGALKELSPAIVAALNNGADAAMMGKPVSIERHILGSSTHVATGCYHLEASISPGWKPAVFNLDKDGRVSLSNEADALDMAARDHLISRCEAAASANAGN